MSFRREAHVPRGGPDGGNGGHGGVVTLVADDGVTDLSAFRTAVHHKAEPGAPGEGSRRHGRAGSDLEVRVPPGTRVLRDDSVIATLDAPGDRITVAQGGEGGIGNRAFRSSRHQAPRETVPGMPGEETWLTLELRLPVDVALVGLPNSGKSALLHALTNASAHVAPYPHSTTDPAFGPLEDEAGHLFLAADLPGVAEDGTPRRQSYLEQLERARVIVHCVSAAEPEDAGPRLRRVREGIAEFRRADAREVVVATFADLGDPAAEAAFAVDSEGGEGVDELRDHLLDILGEGL